MVPNDFIRQAVEEAIPVHKFLGVELIEIRKGYVKIRIPFRDEIVGDPRTKRWHGGILATVIDSVGGIIGTTYMSSFQDKISTIDLRVDYLKGAESSAIIADGELVSLGNRIMVTKMRVYQEDTNVLLAEGKGVYNFIRMQEGVEIYDFIEQKN